MQIRFRNKLGLAFLVMLAIPYSKGEIPKTLTFPSPDGQWALIAKYFKNGSFPGYRTKLLNRKTHKVYCDETVNKIEDNEILPESIKAFWSPNSKYLVINYHYGRICYGTTFRDLTYDIPKSEGLTGIVPQLRDLENSVEMVGESAGPWINKTDIKVNLDFKSPPGRSPYPDSTYSLLIRLKDHRGVILSKKLQEL